MNVERMLAVADAIERGEKKWLGFNMGNWYSQYAPPGDDYSGRGCGTVACLAGWTVAVKNEAISPNDFRAKHKERVCDSAREYFELTSAEAKALFYPTTLGYAATHCEGARHLRWAALTGKCSWASREEEERKRKA